MQEKSTRALEYYEKCLRIIIFVDLENMISTPALNDKITALYGKIIKIRNEISQFEESELSEEFVEFLPWDFFLEIGTD